MPVFHFQLRERDGELQGSSAGCGRVFGKAEVGDGGAGRYQKGQQHGAKSMGNGMGMYWSILACAVLVCVFRLRQSGLTDCQLGKIIRLPRTPSSC